MTRLSGIGSVLPAAAFLVFATASSVPATGQDYPPSEQDETSTNAVPRTSAIFVKDWDASIRFYTSYLGYEASEVSAIESAKSRATLGIPEGVAARIVYLRPVQNRITRPWTGSGLALIDVGDPASEPATQDRLPANRGRAIRGEIALVHEVVEIQRIYEAMQHDEKVTIVVPLGPSATGRSQSFSVIDPNGIRLEMYEFVEQ